MEPEVTLLTSDKEIPGQKYTLLSFVSPETVLKNKDVYYSPNDDPFRQFFEVTKSKTMAFVPIINKI
jgi:hypothetical protein